MASAITELFRHNLWANLRLLDFCATLDDQQLSAAMPGTYGAVSDTLTHLFAAESRYVARLRGRNPGNEVHESKGFPGIEALRASAVRSGEELITIVEERDPHGVLRGEWRGEPFEMPVIIPVIQAINHATEHRAHVISTLSNAGIIAPDLDAWAYNEDPQVYLDSHEGS